MNNIKKIALSLLVVGLAIGTQSYKNAEKKRLLTDWYAPISSTLSSSDPLKNSFSSYNSTPLEEEPGCNQEQYVCAAQFPNTSVAPTSFRYINQ